MLEKEAQLYESIWAEGLVSRSKNLAYSYLSKITENLSKTHLLELFAVNTRSFQVNILTSKDSVMLI